MHLGNMAQSDPPADDGALSAASDAGPPEGANPDRPLTPAARRALAEAQARRAEIDRQAKALPKERAGRKGPEPTRYGDWEVKGIASDF
jgi:hypothetical protein